MKNPNKKLNIEIENSEGNWEWVNEDLEPILPEAYDDKVKLIANFSFNMKYDALVNKGLFVTEEEKDQMWMFFKMEGEYEKSIDVLKAYNKLEQKRDDDRNDLLKELLGE
jgi:hypothetical protein